MILTFPNIDPERFTNPVRLIHVLKSTRELFVAGKTPPYPRGLCRGLVRNGYLASYMEDNAPFELRSDLVVQLAQLHILRQSFGAIGRYHVNRNPMGNGCIASCYDNANGAIAECSRK